MTVLEQLNALRTAGQTYAAHMAPQVRQPAQAGWAAAVDQMMTMAVEEDWDAERICDAAYAASDALRAAFEAGDSVARKRSSDYAYGYRDAVQNFYSNVVDPRATAAHNEGN